MRRPTGGDPNRKALNLHHGVLVSDAFMRAVETDEQWALKSPADGTVQQTISARNLWIRLLTAVNNLIHKFLAEIVCCTVPSAGLFNAHCSSVSTALMKASETKTP